MQKEQQRKTTPFTFLGYLLSKISFLARINILLSTGGISLERGSFIYSTSRLNDRFTD